ncbi:uncharacterized protein LOC107619695 isoform X1 [Arachis ipaensis]|uniref:uncharacterized protein LOC107619695 isoform X1 n=1 Tax=Arachis ipaensis TaxID=130454 RepID=UPI0007AF9D38|nr:uncharacterized protein LOC107619695 isoform X1 [Arachis ipaensis]XP_020966642.1 uncharacterized protein LOC107619695 isoform X1 [Arachis ipaensis]XP_020966643.1 uncharacterized protein LOC107619695 isoform X1 [Arachis ipaensis]XP_020966644.1 uncharacterized protein LOC107619695 isoform X1 [Arachis ipaensis]XP_020966645.1 uncharacterized protein LOC107619695 isoform X1 [Arachis ipaensis]XP_025674913.1 uncharacterized protein LOC112775493 [Arachis hypogaea]XP_025674914.1 uncharacterized pro
MCLQELAGREERLSACEDLGADVVVNYKTEDSVARLKEETRAKGVDVIMDQIVGLYLQRNLNNRSIDKRLFLIGGAIVKVNLNTQHRHRSKRKNFARNANRGTAVRDFSSVSENRGLIPSQLLSKDSCRGLWPSPGKQSAIGLITVEQQR